MTIRKSCDTCGQAVLPGSPDYAAFAAVSLDGDELWHLCMSCTWHVFVDGEAVREFLCSLPREGGGRESVAA